MKKTLAAEQLTDKQRDILRALKAKAESTPGHAITARGARSLAEKILPVEFRGHEAEYAQAVCGLMNGGLVKCNTSNPHAALPTYKLTAEAEALSIYQTADA